MGLQAEPAAHRPRLGSGVTYREEGMGRAGSAPIRENPGDPELAASADEVDRELVLMGREDMPLREARQLAGTGFQGFQSIRIHRLFYQIEGRTREASEAFRRSMELDPGNLSALMSMISIAYNRGWAGPGVDQARAVVDPDQPCCTRDSRRSTGSLEDGGIGKSQQDAERIYQRKLYYVRAVNSRALGRIDDARGVAA